MSTAGPYEDVHGAGGAGGGPASEEELRAAYEAEIKKVRVEHVLLEHTVALVNLGMRRTGLQPGTESERDPSQVRLAIESIRALMPLLEQSAPQHAGQIKSALSQLQLAFVRIGGPAAGAEGGGPAAGGGSAAGGGPAGGGPAGDRATPAQPPAEDAGAPRAGEPAPTSGDPGPKSGEPGPAQRSGRLWVPGQ